MPKEVRKSAPNDEPAFEDAMKRLEQIVAEMESGELALETLIARHEEGVRLVAICNERLEAARRRIEIVEEKGGTVATKPFDPSTQGAASATGKPGRSKAEVPNSDESHDETSLF